MSVLQIFAAFPASGRIPSHLIVVLLHGWDNFASMVTEWKRHPEYTPGDRS